jgi:predicted nucleic acid-binding protein
VPRGGRKVEPPLVYLDTDVYVDLLTLNTEVHSEDGRLRHIVAKEVFEAIENGDIRLAASALTEAEIGCNASKAKNKQNVEALLASWFTARSTTWIEIDRHLAREAVRLANAWRADNAVPGKKMSTADALHLAAAVATGSHYFMTYDGGHPIAQNVEGVQIIRPAVVWQQDLWASASGE